MKMLKVVDQGDMVVDFKVTVEGWQTIEQVDGSFELERVYMKQENVDVMIRFSTGIPLISDVPGLGDKLTEKLIDKVVKLMGIQMDNP